MSVDVQPTLRGSLIELHPLRAEHWDALFAVASDPLIWEQHPNSDRHQEPVFREFFDVALASGSAFVVRDAADGRIIGSSRFHGHDPVKREIEIGWTFLARDYWGGRYNREMKRLMIRHALQFVDSVIFVVGPNNVRSRTAVERIGGVLDGIVEVRGRLSVVYRVAVVPDPL